jgi:hypothetical protein
VAEVTVPATLQAAIAARIDRVNIGAKKTINAAAVIGLRFTASLLTVLGVDPVLDELVKAELIDQVRFTPRAEYAFRHPLIRAVAYESQLKSDRGELHRRLAAAIQERHPESMDENAALIAEHLETAGDLHAAYGWHMRAGAWSRVRDVSAARVSWERARQIADALPADDANPLPCASPHERCCAPTHGGSKPTPGPFSMNRELCTVAGDKASLAIGMMGMVLEALTRDGFAKPRNGRQNICRSWNQSAMRRSLSPCPLGRSPSGF